VVVQGAEQTRVDASWIAANPAPLEWGEGRAWPLGPLLGEAFASGGTLRVTPRGGEAVTFDAPGTRRDGRVPLLVVNRKGEAVVTLGDPAAGPAVFHGRGGARGRAGDGATRVVDVVRVEHVPGQARSAPTPAEPGPISVVAAGDHASPLALITAEALDAVPEIALQSADGAPLDQRCRDLRAVAEALFGGARVEAVVGEDGARLAISEARWMDPTWIPALRVNKQGHWRFQWVKGRVLRRGVPGVRDVTGLIVAP